MHILVSNYTNKHIKFSKGEYIGHLENINEGKKFYNPMKMQMPIQQAVLPWREWCKNKWNQTHLNHLTTTLKPSIETKLEALLKEYESQFAWDETSIGTTPLTEISIYTGNSEPVSQKPYPITMKHYQWVKDKIEKLLTAKVIQGSRSSWSAPIIVVPKGDGGKH